MTSLPLILICDHSGRGLSEEAGHLAEEGFPVETSTNLRRSLDRLKEAPRPGLLVVSPMVRGGQIELAELERRRNEGPAIPLLVVTDRDEEGAALRFDRIFQSGDWDLLWHGASREELFLRVDRLRRTTRMRHEMEELRHLASHDDRTDLLRPKTFQARLVEHFSAAQRHKLQLALVLIDLDRFGQINKEHDHTVGDALITRVGDVIRRTLRTEDVAGRLGGDEFGVLLPYTGKIDAARVVNRLREEIVKLSGREGEDTPHLHVSGSLGFETFDGNDLDSLETLRRHAERALRQAKRQGGDQAVYYRSLSEDELAG